VIWVTVLFSLFLFALIVFDDMGKLNFLLLLMDSFPYGDKIVHFFFIGTLSFLINRTAMQLLPRKTSWRVSMVVSVFLLAVFTIEETSQRFIAGRNASFADLAANYAGIIIFALLAYQTRIKNEDALVVMSA
jgi:VanZ family protein